MESLLQQPIKQVIGDHAAVGTLLEEYGVGCVPCSVGSCLLKDIVNIHALSPEAEQELLTRIAKVVYPDRDVLVPLRRRERAASNGRVRYSPPMKMLVDEHVLIKRLLALLPALQDRIELESEPGRKAVLDAVDFIRSYADAYHHAKEEDILFEYFDEGLDILQVIRADHETGRSHVKAVVQAVRDRDADAAVANLGGYRELLLEHIKKEDEILYPWMDRELSDSQIGRLFSRFQEVDSRFGDTPEKWLLAASGDG